MNSNEDVKTPKGEIIEDYAILSGYQLKALEIAQELGYLGI